MVRSSSEGRFAGSRPPVPQPLRSYGRTQPNRLYVSVPGLPSNTAQRLSQMAVERAQKIAPKLSGAGAASIQPFYGDDFFGLAWDRPYMWDQEAGTRPFTMRSLAGKTIPMWIDDPTGKMEREQGPRARTRITASGKKQVLIFRRAARIGQRKTVTTRRADGSLIRRDVPASYPGAPGRIAHRQIIEYPRTTGRIAKMVSRAHVGVRWRHPGIIGRGFMHHALITVASEVGVGNPVVHAAFERR